MKNKQIYWLCSLLIVLGVLLLSGCNNYDECPPLNKGYSTTYIVPDGVYLSANDWLEMEALEKEYEAYLTTIASAD